MHNVTDPTDNNTTNSIDVELTDFARAALDSETAGTTPIVDLDPAPATRAEVLACLPADDSALTIIDRALFEADTCNGGVKATVERHDARNDDGTVEQPQYLVTFAPINRGGHEVDITADRIPFLIAELARLHWSYKKMEALDRLFDCNGTPTAEQVIRESRRSGIPADQILDDIASRVCP